MHMQKIAFAVITAASLLIAGNAGAATHGAFGSIASESAQNSNVVNVHSRQSIHDNLHDDGYDPVIFQKQWYDDYGKPVYRFRACDGHRAYRIDVNWYGEIIRKRSAGRCYRKRRYRDHNDW